MFVDPADLQALEALHRHLPEGLDPGELLGWGVRLAAALAAWQAAKLGWRGARASCRLAGRLAAWAGRGAKRAVTTEPSEVALAAAELLACPRPRWCAERGVLACGALTLKFNALGALEEARSGDLDVLADLHPREAAWLAGKARRVVEGIEAADRAARRELLLERLRGASPGA